MHHPASSQLIPNLGATSQFLTCLNFASWWWPPFPAVTSLPHFLLPALCFPASLFQSITNPCCSLLFSPLLHPDPNPHLWDVSSFPSLFTQPWEWSTARQSLLCTLALLTRKSSSQAIPAAAVQPQGRERSPSCRVVSLENLPAKLRRFPPRYPIMSPPSIKALQGFPQTFLEVVWMFFSLWAHTKPEAGIQLRNFSQNKSGSAGIWSCGPIMENVWHLQQVVLLPVPPQCPVWDRNSAWPQDYLGLISLFP